jgi:predicted RND superfamily exporter protein
MAPVFLMAIATDSIHIFNEFYFRYRESHNRRAAIIETMHAVQRPVQYTALATAAGFAVLMFMNIIPVKVFGGLVAFGTVMLRVLSFSFIPAMFALVSEKSLATVAAGEETDKGFSARALRGLAGFGGRRPWLVVGVSSVLLAVAIYGLTTINVNNNLVNWFKSSSEVRIADHDLNKALGGTSLAYIIADGQAEDVMKNPEALKSIEALQRKLETLHVVGKTTSVVDYIKRINRVLHNDDPAYDKIPDNAKIVAQYLFIFNMSAKPSDLDNVVDPSFRKANIWVQLKTWDATAMRQVADVVHEWKAPALVLAPPVSVESEDTNPDAPATAAAAVPAAAAVALPPMTFKPAGIAWFNLVWNDEVLWDMVRGFIASLVIVFVILAFNFRSIPWAVVGYLPLLFTVALIYATIGFLGLDFDMPVSVLSCLSLGMAVDFAIHFISRFRQRLHETVAVGVKPSAELVLDALQWTAARPGKGIVRNAILFAASFSVMLFASLTPYISVGAFIVSMMAISALMTILGLPALIMIFHNWLLPANTGTPLPDDSAHAAVPAGRS